ncbi:hypothetical protein GGH95_000098 [Coemansia sp. RSA 1836]|nr:hypothetical protein GGH95_000098 [Coemansia sp. RSA 1836]
MSATIHIVDDEPQLKEFDSLPLPSTTGVASSSSISSGINLLQILHYLNPLFYARLVQAYIQTVLESYSAANCRSNAPRIISGEGLTRGGSVVARRTTIDNCFTTVSPEFEYSHRLGLDGTCSPNASTAQILAPLSDICLRQSEAKGSRSGRIAESVASLATSAPSPPPNATGTPASMHSTEKDDKPADMAEGKRARKAKRGKGKGKGKS